MTLHFRRKYQKKSTVDVMETFPFFARCNFKNLMRKFKGLNFSESRLLIEAETTTSTILKLIWYVRGWRVVKANKREIEFSKPLPTSVCMLMKNLSRKELTTCIGKMKTGSFAPENAFVAAIFLAFIDFLFAGGRLDLRVLIEVTWPRRLCHKKGANFIMSGYKYSPQALHRRRLRVYVCLYSTRESNGKTWIQMGEDVARDLWASSILSDQCRVGPMYQLISN